MRLLTKIFLFECLLSNEFTKWPGLLYPTRTYSDSCVLSVGKVGNLMIYNLSTYRVLLYTGCNKIDGGRIQFKGAKETVQSRITDTATSQNTFIKRAINQSVGRNTSCCKNNRGSYINGIPLNSGSFPRSTCSLSR